MEGARHSSLGPSARPPPHTLGALGVQFAASLSPGVFP